MLVLTVKPGESVHIGNDTHVMVVRSNSTGDRIKLGITAPRDVPIRRDCHLAAEIAAQSQADFDACETVQSEIEIIVNSIVEDPAHVTG